MMRLLAGIIFFLASPPLLIAQDPLAKPIESSSKSKPTNASNQEFGSKTKSSPLKRWSEAEQKELLSRRIDGNMSGKFRDFANMYLVFSRIKIGTGISLMAKSRSIQSAELLSPFPETYKPTLAEFLDAISLQTASEWKYDSSNEFVEMDSEVKELESPLDELVVFEFSPLKRSKPYEVTLPKGWKKSDKGSWVLFSPPSFPIGLDIYEMGTYSPEDGKPNEDFLKKIRIDVSMQWANRLSPNATQDELKDAKVGMHDALYYETMTPSQLGSDVKWRQWVFMVDDRCFFIVSTILPSKEAAIYPDVEKILSTFQIISKE